MSTIREIVEGIQYVGEDESVIFTLTTTNWGSTPTSTSAKIFSLDAAGAKTDVTSTKMTGSTSVSGDIITLPVIAGLTAGTRYRVETKFTVSGNALEAYFIIVAET